MKNYRIFSNIHFGPRYSIIDGAHHCDADSSQQAMKTLINGNSNYRSLQVKINHTWCWVSDVPVAQGGVLGLDINPLTWKRECSATITAEGYSITKVSNDVFEAFCHGIFLKRTRTQWEAKVVCERHYLSHETNNPEEESTHAVSQTL